MTLGLVNYEISFILSELYLEFTQNTYQSNNKHSNMLTPLATSCQQPSIDIFIRTLTLTFTTVTLICQT